MRNYRLITNAIAFSVPSLLPFYVFAQAVDTSSISTVTATSAVTLDMLLRQGQGVYDAFKMVGALAGVAAIVNFLVNMTKYGPVNEFIARKKVKWVRPILALLAGLIGGFSTALARGLPWSTSALYAFGGLFAGGGAIAIHELWVAIQGEG